MLLKDKQGVEGLFRINFKENFSIIIKRLA